MTSQTNWTRVGPLIVALVAWVSLGVAASCSSDDQATLGGRAENPVEPSPKVTNEAAKVRPPPSVVPSQASAVVTSAPSKERPLSESETFEQRTGMKLSPVEKAIMDDCPSRVWSKSVPKRGCTKDSECGDGFCDRGRCAAIWTCITTDYGRRCDKNDECSVHPCIGGRCRSCVAIAECKNMGWDYDLVCNSDPDVSGARRCGGNVRHVMPQAVPASTSGASDAGP